MSPPRNYFAKQRNTDASDIVTDGTYVLLSRRRRCLPRFVDLRTDSQTQRSRVQIPPPQPTSNDRKPPETGRARRRCCIGRRRGRCLRASDVRTWWDLACLQRERFARLQSQPFDLDDKRFTSNRKRKPARDGEYPYGAVQTWPGVNQSLRSCARQK